MMNPKLLLASTLATALQQPPFAAAITADQLLELFEIPKDSSLGDLALPCFTFAKELRRAPQQIAQQLAESLNSDALRSAWADQFSSVIAVGGYLNATYQGAALATRILEGIRSGSALAPRADTANHIMVEYSQLNTHKACHVGHARAASLGDSLSRILAWLGHRVTPVSYGGDEGTHVARCLWYFTTQYKGEVPSANRGEFLGVMYHKATELLELSSYSLAPYPGVTVARVISVNQHPKEPKWSVVTLETGAGERTVVCGLAGLQPGQLVAYANPESRISGRAVGIVERKGITSVGMICAEDEIGLSDQTNKLPEIPAATQIGTEVLELYRTPECPTDLPSIRDLITAREREVSKVLQQLESKEGEIYKIWQETRQWSVDELNSVYEWLDCSFDTFFYESQFGEEGKAIVRKFQKQGIFVESQGAVGADLGAEQLGFCILIKSDGTATYACRDLALAEKKFEDFKVDTSLYIVDAGQALHFKQVFACLKRMGFPQADRCKHISFSIVLRPDGKMSSRKGNVILFSELKNRLATKLEQEFLGRYRGDWSDEEIDLAIRRLSRATIRYGMLKQDNDSQIVFDLDEWTARSGDTGPYMLYAYARISSIVREAHSREVELGQPNWQLLTHETELELIRFLESHEETVRRAGMEYAPHLICSYVLELSKRFNRMYKQCQVLGAETPELRATRLALVEATGTVLKQSLGLLGIETIDRM